MASYKTAERYSRESKELCWHQKSSPSACQQVQQRCQGAPPSFTVTLNPDTSPCLSLQLSSVPKHKLSLLRCRKHERCLTKPTTPHPCEPPRCDPRAWPFPLDHPGQAVIWIFTSICIYLSFLRTAEEPVTSRKHRWCLWKAREGRARRSTPCRTGAVWLWGSRSQGCGSQGCRSQGCGSQGFWAPQGVHRGAAGAERTRGGAEGAMSTPHSPGVPAGRHGGGCLRAAGHYQTPGLLQPIAAASSGPGGHNRGLLPLGAR